MPQFISIQVLNITEAHPPHLGWAPSAKPLKLKTIKERSP